MLVLVPVPLLVDALPMDVASSIAGMRAQNEMMCTRAAMPPAPTSICSDSGEADATRCTNRAASRAAALTERGGVSPPDEVGGDVGTSSWSSGGMSDGGKSDENVNEGPAAGAAADDDWVAVGSLLLLTCPPVGAIGAGFTLAFPAAFAADPRPAVPNRARTFCASSSSNRTICDAVGGRVWGGARQGQRVNGR